MLNLAKRSVAMVAAYLLVCGVAASPLSCADDDLNPAPARQTNDPGGSDAATATTTPTTTPNLAPLRRLTAVEYVNTVRDLFPTATLPQLSFPAETPAHGFLNNAAVQNPSPVLIEDYQRAADRVAAAVMASDKAPCKGVDVATCAPGYLEEIGGRLFRRPLAADERTAFVDYFVKTTASTDATVALRLTLAAMLQSPQFLYRVEIGRDQPGPNGTTVRVLTDHETATRLSFLLWDSTPDDALLAAASKGEISTPAQIETQARRLLADPHARAAVTRFHEQWLDFQQLAATQKDVNTFPSWNNDLRAAMLKEAQLFVERTIFEGEGTLKALLTSPNTWVNPALADVYGVAAPSPSPSMGDFGAVTLDPSRRGGVLTLPIFLASKAHPVQGSPVLRGKFVLERFFCAPPPDPPPNVDVTPPVAGAAAPKTNRQRYEAIAANKACTGCHAIMDGVGFPFESFDAMGRFRDTDNGESVDTSGTLMGSGQTDGPVKDAHELSQRLAASTVVQHCVTTEWFRYAYGRSEVAADAVTLGDLSKTFSDGGGNVRELLIAIVKHPAFTVLPGSTP